MDAVLNLYGLATSISGAFTLTLSSTLTANRTLTVPDASLTLAGQNYANTFTLLQLVDFGSGGTSGAQAGTHLRLLGADAGNLQIGATTFGNTNGATFYSYNVGGTRASQSATLNGSGFWTFAARGFDTAVTGSRAAFGCNSGSLWAAGTNETYWYWSGTPAGSTTIAEWMRVQNACLGIGTGAPTAGNGLLQLASGTTKANGIALGTDTFIYRSAAGIVNFAGASFSLAVPTISANDTIATLGLANTFTAAQTIDLGLANGSLPAVSLAYTIFRLAQADGSNIGVEPITYGASAAFVVRGRNIGGTRAVPAATPASKQFFNLNGAGYDSTGGYSTARVAYLMQSSVLWTATDHQTEHQWQGCSSGAVSLQTWMYLKGGASEPANMGALGIGASPTTGNGLLQLASGSTKANGIAWGTDCFLFRSAANTLTATLNTHIIAPASGDAAFKLTAGTASFTFTQVASNDTIVGTTTANGVLFRTNSSNAIYFDASQNTTIYGSVTLTDAKNIVVGSTTGSQIGTATTQKIAHWGATPVVQPSSTGETTGWTTGGGSAATSTDTYTGNTGSKAYTINDIVKHLKNVGLIAAS